MQQGGVHNGSEAIWSVGIGETVGAILRGAAVFSQNEKDVSLCQAAFSALTGSAYLLQVVEPAVKRVTNG
jgi:hypothetical protein